MLSTRINFLVSLQVYSPEVLRAFGQALVSLLRNMALYLRAMEALNAQHDTSQWLPRLTFLLLQNPLNGQRSVFPFFQGTASCKLLASWVASLGLNVAPDL